MAEILGLPLSDLMGRSSFDFVYPEDAPQAERLFRQKVHGDANPFTFRLRRYDGSGIWVDVQGTPLQNAAGEFNGIVGTFTAKPDKFAIPDAQYRSDGKTNEQR